MRIERKAEGASEELKRGWRRSGVLTARVEKCAAWNSGEGNEESVEAFRGYNKAGPLESVRGDVLS